jgi:hypothetical protein
MTTTTTTTDATGDAAELLAGPPVDVRLRLAALWTSMLLVFAYVDVFSLYRPDVRAGLDEGRMFLFDVDQTFLLLTTLYVIVPILMIPLSLVLRPRPNRVANIAVALVYAVTIIGGAVGEWGYYVLGSAVEVALLVAVVQVARRWPRTATT